MRRKTKISRREKEKNEREKKTETEWGKNTTSRFFRESYLTAMMRHRVLIYKYNERQVTRRELRPNSTR